jgi:hypothetical protein
LRAFRTFLACIFDAENRGQLSVVSCQLPVVSRQLSVVRGQGSGVRDQFDAADESFRLRSGQVFGELRGRHWGARRAIEKVVLYAYKKRKNAGLRAYKRRD